MTFAAPMPFSGYPLNRASVARRDEALIASLLAHKDTDLLLLHRGQPIVETQMSSGIRQALRLSCAQRSEVLGADAPQPIFLGLDDKGRASFAASLPDQFDLEAGILAGLGEAVDLRMAGASITIADLALFSTAKSLHDWHRRHGFCSNCGAPSLVVEAGWKRLCPSCKTEHFPRTDPVAIMLAVHDDHCLLGRGPGFRAGFISALAGFIEPGETIEEGCARELMEEAGVTMISSRIIANQPWPFPSQLMIALIAQVRDRDLTIDREELTDAIWFTRQQAAALLSEGGCTLDGVTLRAPPPLAIAHHLIKAWVAEG